MVKSASDVQYHAMCDRNRLNERQIKMKNKKTERERKKRTKSLSKYKHCRALSHSRHSGSSHIFRIADSIITIDLHIPAHLWCVIFSFQCCFAVCFLFPSLIAVANDVITVSCSKCTPRIKLSCDHTCKRNRCNTRIAIKLTVKCARSNLFSLFFFFLFVFGILFTCWNSAGCSVNEIHWFIYQQVNKLVHIEN